MADPTVPPFAAPPFTPPQSGPVYNTPVAPPGAPPLRATTSPPPVAVPTVPPVVTGISPATGPTGTSVAVSGTGFTGATAVAFGTVPATSFTVNSDTSITAVSPAGSGTSDLTVTTPAGTSAVTAADKFLSVSPPTVSAIAPAEGPTSGGTAVAITGANLTGATSVKFAGAETSSLVVNNDTSIVVTSPPGAGSVDVVVTTPAGSTATGTKFTYAGIPAVVANFTKEPSVGNNGTVIEKVGTVLVMDPAGYRTKNYGYLSVVLPSGAAIDDVVEMYAVSARKHEGILVSVFPPIGESIGGHPGSTGTNGDAASSVTSNSGRIFRKVSATNWQSLGGNS